MVFPTCSLNSALRKSIENILVQLKVVIRYILMLFMDFKAEFHSDALYLFPSYFGNVQPTA